MSCFHHAPCQYTRRTGDHWHIVGPHNRDGQRLVDISPLVIRGAGDKGFGDDLAFFQGLRAGQVVVEGVDPVAAAAVHHYRAIGA